jgi:formate dehydrogenase major subunit
MGGKVIDIDPQSPINEGTLCPKGAKTFQLLSNSYRIDRVMYRARYATAGSNVRSIGPWTASHIW